MVLMLTEAGRGRVRVGGVRGGTQPRLVGELPGDGDELDEDLLLVVRTSHGVARMSLHRATDGAFLHDIELPGAGTIGGPVERIDGETRSLHTGSVSTRKPSISISAARHVLPTVQKLV